MAYIYAPYITVTHTESNAAKVRVWQEQPQQTNRLERGQLSPCADSGIRTHMISRRILSAVRLPFRHIRIG